MSQSVPDVFKPAIGSPCACGAGVASISVTGGALMAAALAVVYAALALGLHGSALAGDELRYYDDARHLVEGWFVSDENPRIYNGPGYPLVLAPLVAWGAPLLVMRLMGAVMVGLSAWFLWLAARRWMSAGWTAGFVLFCSLQPGLLRSAHLLMTEPLTQLCAAAFLWLFVSALEARRWAGWALAAGAVLACWAMTRVFMGHVIMATLVASGLLLLWGAARKVMGRTMWVMTVALVFCIPYLAYTKAKTGGWMTWATSSGEMLYWMTSYEGGENGHWYSDEQVFSRPELDRRHGAFLRQVAKLSHLERDAAMKEVAVQRFKADPVAVGRNWVCNVSRMLFGFPRSLELERLSPLVHVVVNGGLVCGLVLGVGLVVWRRERVTWSLLPLGLMAAFYVGGSSLAPALPRYFLGVLPVVALVTFGLLSRVPWGRLRSDRDVQS